MNFKYCIYCIFVLYWQCSVMYWVRDPLEFLWLRSLNSPATLWRTGWKQQVTPSICFCKNSCELCSIAIHIALPWYFSHLGKKHLGNVYRCTWNCLDPAGEGPYCDDPLVAQATACLGCSEWTCLVKHRWVQIYEKITDIFPGPNCPKTSAITCFIPT